jgi:hypothetical protein
VFALSRRSPNVVLIQGANNVPFVVYPLVHLETVAPRDKRPRFDIVVAIHVWTIGSPDFEDVTESSRRKQRGGAALSFCQSVDDNSGAVYKVMNMGEIDVAPPERTQDAACEVGRGCRVLGEAQGAGRLVHTHQIGESAPNVYGDAVWQDRSSSIVHPLVATMGELQRAILAESAKFNIGI